MKEKLIVSFLYLMSAIGYLHFKLYDLWRQIAGFFGKLIKKSC
jgi:hypothetical protein